MYISLLVSILLNSNNSAANLGNNIWLERYSLLQKSKQTAVTIIAQSQKSRDESVLRQQAIAQGYVLRDAQIDPLDKDRETFIYSILNQNPDNSELKNVCDRDRTGVSKAMLLLGFWSETGNYIDDSSVVTVACTSGVLAKCVRLGYKPWKEVAGISLQNYHQACTRMARADYCGNGISHTKDGTLIDVYDSLKVQQPEENTGLTFEAAWGIDGAVLLNRTRYPDTLKRLKQECPEKLRQIYPATNSSSASDRLRNSSQALIFNDS